MYAGKSPIPEEVREEPTVAERLNRDGIEVGDPSGAQSVLTPSDAQIAQAKAMAGGKVREMLVHILQIILRVKALQPICSSDARSILATNKALNPFDARKNDLAFSKLQWAWALASLVEKFSTRSHREFLATFPASSHFCLLFWALVRLAVMRSWDYFHCRLVPLFCFALLFL